MSRWYRRARIYDKTYGDSLIRNNFDQQATILNSLWNYYQSPLLLQQYFSKKYIQKWCKNPSLNRGDGFLKMELINSIGWTWEFFEFFFLNYSLFGFHLIVIFMWNSEQFSLNRSPTNFQRLFVKQNLFFSINLII